MTKKNFENGRSMVEMLGVLAVMGILSVAGIAGYNNAMNKYRANELLNEASKRAVVIVPQIAMGNTPSIAEFTNNDLGYGTFVSTVYGENGTDSWANTDKKFTLSITGVSEAVCNQMKNSTGGVIKDFKPDTCASGNGNNVKLTYNNDMSTTDVANSGGGATSECDPACGAGQECVGGACVTVTPNSSNGCSKNSDCNTWCETNGYDKCYCAISSSPNWNDSNCYTSFTGTCAKVETKSGISGGYVASNGTMTWWSAVNFCKAAKTGGKLVSLSDLGITGGYEDEAYCEGSSCTGANWSDLQSKLGYDYYWVTDAVSCTDPENGEGCTSGSNNNSCYALGVDLGGSGVYGYGRGDGSYFYTMCE